MESALKGLVGAERESRRKALEEAESHKKGHVSEADSALALEAKEKAAAAQKVGHRTNLYDKTKYGYISMLLYIVIHFMWSVALGC